MRFCFFLFFFSGIAQLGNVAVPGVRNLLAGNNFALLFYVHDKHLRSYRDGQLT